MDAKSRMSFINSVADVAQTPVAAPAPVQAAAPVSAATQPVQDAEPVSIFALGLPAWDLVPPQVALWRKKK